MIIIPFVPGSFASTVEYVLRNYTLEYAHDKIDAKICDDGSMHSFVKTNHIYNSQLLEKNIIEYLNTNKILTPIYPFVDLHARETIDIINQYSPEKIVFLYVHDLEYAEINMLFQYYKIALGLNAGLDIFFSNNYKPTDWNKNYTSWKEMAIWELREWLSIFYLQWVNEWIEAVNYVDTDIKISTKDILDDTPGTFRKIINCCALTECDSLDNFALEWRNKQQYVLDEYRLINQIVQAVLNQQDFAWNKLNIISEAILQQKLRSNGFEIKCWNLNQFPTNSRDFELLLEKTQ